MVYNRSRGYDDLYVANLDGGGETRLTRTKADEAAPAWSPVGSKIAFVEVRPLPDVLEGDLYVVGTQGGKPSFLASHINVSGGGRPQWSPDGRQILVVRSDVRNGGLFVVDAAGVEAPERILENAVYPAWSPDGTGIAFLRYEGGWELYVARFDGSGQEKIVPTSRNPSDLAWSPDGSKIAFTGLAPHTFAEAIFTIRPDGTQLLRLTNAHAIDLVWSPDGRKIAFTRQRGAFNVWLVGAESAPPVALTRGKRDKDVLAWLTFR
jgi:Tol biopolymer transport system component